MNEHLGLGAQGNPDIVLPVVTEDEARCDKDARTVEDGVGHPLPEACPGAGRQRGEGIAGIDAAPEEQAARGGAESPGRQPITIPRAVLNAIATRFIGERALMKPAPMSDKVSNIKSPYKRASNNSPRIRLTFSTRLKVTNTSARIAAVVMQTVSGFIFNLSRTQTIKMTVAG